MFPQRWVLKARANLLGETRGEKLSNRAANPSLRVTRVYSVLSKVYDGAFDWALGPGRREAVAALDVQPGDHVLEVGVGTGLSLPLFPSGCRVTGIDITPSMLEKARERTVETRGITVDLTIMDARRLDFADCTFDHVLAPYVVSVVPEPEQVMQEMARVCRPGGSVVVVNHFRSPGRVLGAVEGLLSPLSQWVGFRLDLPVETAMRSAGLELVGIQRVNLLGLWRLLVFRRLRQ